MSNKYAIIKNNYVINYIVIDDIDNYQYPEPYDFIYHDVNDKAFLGAWYEQSEDIFYIPFKDTPPDSPFFGSFTVSPNNQ